MSPLSQALPHLAQTIAAMQHVDLFCDYDGVLAPLPPSLQQTQEEYAAHMALEKLVKRSSFHVAIVTGRQLSDIQQRVKIPGVTHVGNHGLDISGPDVERTQELSEHLPAEIAQLNSKLEKIAKRYPGIFLENKTTIIGIHYRQVDPNNIPSLLADVDALMEESPDDLLCLTSGKQMLEIRPVAGWHKGQAVEWLLEQRHGADWQKNTVAIYIGDDVTDEDAFRTLHGKGITIRVEHGIPQETAAQYTLKDTTDVCTFLEWLDHTGV